MKSNKPDTLLALAVVTMVVLLTYLVVLFTLGPERMPGLGAVLMAVAISFLLIHGSTWIGRMIQRGKWFD